MTMVWSHGLYQNCGSLHQYQNITVYTPQGSFEMQLHQVAMFEMLLFHLYSCQLHHPHHLLLQLHQRHADPWEKKIPNKICKIPVIRWESNCELQRRSSKYLFNQLFQDWIYCRYVGCYGQNRKNWKTQRWRVCRNDLNYLFFSLSQPYFCITLQRQQSSLTGLKLFQLLKE